MYLNSPDSLIVYIGCYTIRWGFACIEILVSITFEEHCLLLVYNHWCSNGMDTAVQYYVASVHKSIDN